MAAGDDFRSSGGRLLEGKTHGPLEAARGEPLPHDRRQRIEVRAHGTRLLRLQRRIEAAHGALHEAACLVWAAEQITPALPLGHNLLGLHGVLRKDGARAFLAILGIAPTGLYGLGSGREPEVEGELTAAALAQQYRIHQRAGDRAALVGERHGDSGSFADLLGLAQDHFQHGAVDRAVRGVEQHRAHEPGGLTEAIDAPLALLMPRRIPRQIVMHNGIEQAL